MKRALVFIILLISLFLAYWGMQISVALDAQPEEIDADSVGIERVLGAEPTDYEIRGNYLIYWSEDYDSVFFQKALSDEFRIIFRELEEIKKRLDRLESVTFDESDDSLLIPASLWKKIQKARVDSSLLPSTILNGAEIDSQ